MVFKKNKVLKLCMFTEKPKSYLVYFCNGMQEKLERGSSHLKSAHTVADFQ